MISLIVVRIELQKERLRGEVRVAERLGMLVQRQVCGLGLLSLARASGLRNRLLSAIPPLRQNNARQTGPRRQIAETLARVFAITHPGYKESDNCYWSFIMKNSEHVVHIILKRKQGSCPIIVKRETEWSCFIFGSTNQSAWSIQKHLIQCIVACRKIFMNKSSVPHNAVKEWIKANRYNFPHWRELLIGI